VAPIKSHAANERLAKHLENHLADLFTFLRDPAVDATNWRAEVQAILMTILVTANQQTINTLDFLKQTLTSPQTHLLPISDP
jgi:hypothetical protein